MNKQELISHIQEGIKTEESAIAIYSRHLSAIISRSGLSEEKISRIKRILETLIKANEKHKAFLKSLINRIQEESKDVY